MGNFTVWAGMPAWFNLIISIFLFVLLLLWLFMPLMVISIQKKTIRLVELNERIAWSIEENNRLLEQQNQSMEQIVSGDE